MGLKDYQELLLELLEQLELDMSNLYKLFAVKFPKYADLWASLSQQEIQHAAWVKKLAGMAKEEKAVFDEKVTKTYTVKRVLEMIQDTYAKTQAGKISLMSALSISRDFEQSILEKEFYNYFMGKDAESKLLLNQIRAETLDHQNRIRKAWEEERKVAFNMPRKV